jgi:hypothetical protein
LAEDGLVIDMNALIAIHDIQQDYMIVDAGATWRAVLDASLAHGLTPPVLPNYLDLSVGGTLAISTAILDSNMEPKENSRSGERSRSKLRGGSAIAGRS